MLKFITRQSIDVRWPLAGATPSRVQHSLSVSIFASARAYLLWVSKPWRLRRAERQLGSLDDRMLKDIAIARSEIRRAVRGGYHGEPGPESLLSTLCRFGAGLHLDAHWRVACLSGQARPAPCQRGKGVAGQVRREPGADTARGLESQGIAARGGLARASLVELPANANSAR
jgi:uncharacterized protein YjiS (DUF1127 family)